MDSCSQSFLPHLPIGVSITTIPHPYQARPRFVVIGARQYAPLHSTTIPPCSALDVAKYIISNPKSLTSPKHAPFTSPKSVSFTSPKPVSFTSPKPISLPKSMPFTSPKPVSLSENKQVKSKKSNFSLPDIYNTEIPASIKKRLRTPGSCIITLKAPTGLGKTFALTRIVGELCDSKNPGTVLFPYRVSVKSMYEYQLVANRSDLLIPINLGYGMRGDISLKNKQSVQLLTVGYWLEKALNDIKNNKMKNKIIVLDEAHDASWQTDLALRLLTALIINDSSCNIKLIISSATSTPFDDSPLSTSFIIPERPKNVHLKYMKRSVESDDYDTICSKLAKIYNKTDGNVLVVLPGEAEINKLMRYIEGDTTFDLTNVCTLFSAMDDSVAVAAALCKADNTDNYIVGGEMKKDETNPIYIKPRNLILSTNITENSITIDNLNVVFDLGKRKEMYISEDGVTRLQLINCSKENLIQSTGRCGRQGKIGYGYMLYTEEEYNMLKDHLLNEVHRNPPYKQILKLIQHNLNHEIILEHVGKVKLDTCVKYLLSKNVLERVENNKIEVTETGEIVAKMNLSIRAGSFLATVLNRFDKEYWPYAVIITAWMETTYGVFFFPRREYKESKESYDTKMDTANNDHREFLCNDSFITTFYVWMRSWTDGYRTMREWCKENSLSHKNLYALEKSIKRISDSCRKIIPSFNFWSYKDVNTYPGESGRVVTSEIKDRFDQFDFVIQDLYGILLNLNPERVIIPPVCSLHGICKTSRIDNRVMMKDRPTSSREKFLTFGIRQNDKSKKYFVSKLLRL